MMLVSILQYRMMDNPRKSCKFAGMEFTILPYDRLSDFIRENENLRQTLLQSGGIMKYVAEHIDDPTNNDTLPLFVQYQNYVAENYRRANRYNPNRQHWSVNDLRQRALNGSNHLWEELQSLRVLMRKLLLATDMPSGAKSMVNILSCKYYEYAWKEDLRRRRPDIDTDLGTYKYVMEQFERFGWPMGSDGLACRSIDIALKIHHGYELTEKDIFDSFNIEMFHTHFFWPTIIDRMERGLVELFHGKNAPKCRTEAMNMLKRVQWFSQHIYNDEVKNFPNESFTIEDKKWLRSLLEHYDKDSFSREELSFFYFGKLLTDIGRIWEKQTLSYPDIDLSELEKEANSIINTNPYFRQITWEVEKQCFKNAVLYVMDLKRKKDGNYLFDKNTLWMAVYRFAIDIGIMYDRGDPNEPQDKSAPQYAFFEKFAHELQLDADPPTRHPFKVSGIDSLNKNSYKRYRQPYPWSMDGLKKPSKGFTLYKELNAVYNALHNKFFNLNKQAFLNID
jgi:hypothetical protein